MKHLPPVLLLGLGGFVLLDNAQSIGVFLALYWDRVTTAGPSEAFRLLLVPALFLAVVAFVVHCLIWGRE